MECGERGQRRMQGGHRGKPRVADFWKTRPWRADLGGADARVARWSGLTRGMTHSEEYQLVLRHGCDRRHRARSPLTTPRTPRLFVLKRVQLATTLGCQRRNAISSGLIVKSFFHRHRVDPFCFQLAFKNQEIFAPLKKDLSAPGFISRRPFARRRHSARRAHRSSIPSEPRVNVE